jgi:hypothetical protein
MDRGSCLSWNVCLIIQIWRGLLLLNGCMYQWLLHIDQRICLNPLNHKFWSCSSHSTAGVTGIFYNYAALIKKSKRMNDQQNVETNLKSHLFLNKERFCQNNVIRTFVIQYFQFHLTDFNKSTALGFLWNTFRPRHNDSSLCEISSQELDNVWYQLIPHCSLWNYTRQLKELSIKQHKIFSRFVTL